MRSLPPAGRTGRPCRWSSALTPTLHPHPPQDALGGAAMPALASLDLSGTRGLSAQGVSALIQRIGALRTLDISRAVFTPMTTAAQVISRPYTPDPRP